MIFHVDDTCKGSSNFLHINEPFIAIFLETFYEHAIKKQRVGKWECYKYFQTSILRISVEKFIFCISKL